MIGKVETVEKAITKEFDDTTEFLKKQWGLKNENEANKSQAKILNTQEETKKFELSIQKDHKHGINQSFENKKHNVH